MIGVQYMAMSFGFPLIGIVLAMLIRAELAAPGVGVVNARLYNGNVTLHGTVMIFLWLIPALVGLANYIVPLMIGAEDMAFPRLNALSFWLFLVAGLLIVLGFVFGPAEAGWTAYAPLRPWPAAVLLDHLRLIVNSLLFDSRGDQLRTTDVTMRAPGLTFWSCVYRVSLLAMTVLIFMGTPSLTAGLFMQLFDRSLGTVYSRRVAVATPQSVATTVLVHSHPAEYIMCAGDGALSEVIPVIAPADLRQQDDRLVSIGDLGARAVGVGAPHVHDGGVAPAILFPR